MEGRVKTSHKDVPKGKKNQKESGKGLGGQAAAKSASVMPGPWNNSNSLTSYTRATHAS